ncbi:MAG: extracellular solute-binding protein [Hyphomonadaceae bacterium]
MSSFSRRVFMAGASAAALAACTQQREAGAGGHVNVYSARHYDADRAIYNRFTELTGIEVRVLPANGDQLIERLRQEGDQTEADLIVTVDGGNLWRLTEAGLLQPSTSPTLEAAVPERFSDPQQRWWAFSKRIRVMMYRREIVDPATLSSMDDLAAARFRDEVVARSSTNTYNLSMLAARIERAGRENALAWARGVRENFARDPQGGDIEQIRAVAAGQAELTISNHYYYLRLQNSEDPADRAVAEQVGVFLPDQQGPGVHVNISGAGVCAYARRPEAAQRLLDYLVHDDAQRTIQELNWEFPIRPDAALLPQLSALGRFHEEQIPFDALGRRQSEAARVYEEAGWR